jgi:hypothetical protein
MINKKIGLIALLAGFAVSDVLAGTLTNFASGDVLVCFRNAGNDMVVDAGSLSTLTNATANQRIPITQYTGTQLALVGINGVSWSAFTWLTNNDSLFVTKPRNSLNVQTSPWHDASDPAQSGVEAFMAKIPPGAVDEMNFKPANTSSAIVEEDVSDGNPNYTHGISYHAALGNGLNFNGNFQGNPENTTLSTFTTDGVAERSDFYRLIPTGGFGLGVLLGYFELNTNGVMTYVAYPSAVPTLQSISRSGTSTTINYTTGLYGAYTLRGTNSLTSGTPSINWPAISVLSSGDTTTHSTTFTDTNDIEFYLITAQ